MKLGLLFFAPIALAACSAGHDATLPGDDAGARDAAPPDAAFAIDPSDAAPVPDASPPDAGPPCQLDPQTPLVGAGVAPSVVTASAGGYAMWYGGFSHDSGRIFTMTSQDGVAWSAASLVGSLHGFFPHVLRAPSGEWMLFLNPDQITSADQNRVWVSRSPDGATWGAPTLILAPGAAGTFDDVSIQEFWPLYARGQYWLYYTAFGSTATPNRQTMGIGLATSADGVTWTRHDGAVLEHGASGRFDSGGVFGPGVLFDGTTFTMFYSAAAAGSIVVSVGRATSTDGITWTRDDAPVIACPGLDACKYGFRDPSPLVEDGGTTLYLGEQGGDTGARIVRARCR